MLIILALSLFSLFIFLEQYSSKFLGGLKPLQPSGFAAPVERLRNGIFVTSNAKRFTEFTNCNLSQRLVEVTLLFFNDVEEHEFPSHCTKSCLKLGERFFSTVT